MIEKLSILVLCTGNSARSQMTEGLLRSRVGDRFRVESAGTHPSVVRPEAIAVMEEVGVDLSGSRSKSVDEFAGDSIDFVLTVCDNARENCPYFPARTMLVHHPFDDPAAVDGDERTRLAAFRRVRDAISEYLDNEFLKVVDEKAPANTPGPLTE